MLIAAMERVRGAGLLLVGASSFEGLALHRLPRVRVVQESDFARVRAWLASAVVAVLPRSQCSGYPIKLLNYLGLGLPVVCAAGSSQSSKGTVTVPNRDVAALLEALRDLATHGEERRRLGRAGREWVVNCCSWDARAEELEKLYEKIMTGQSDRRPRSLGWKTEFLAG